MMPRRLRAPQDWAAVLRLIRTEFAYMDERIDPPSSIHRLTEGDLAALSETAEIWAIGDPPLACMVLTPKDDALYIGKLAVAGVARGKGHARRLIDMAALRARALGLAWLELQVRVELLENQRAFAAMGFVQTRATAHPGYDRPTSLTFRRPVDQAR